MKEKRGNLARMERYLRLQRHCLCNSSVEQGVDADMSSMIAQ